MVSGPASTALVCPRCGGAAAVVVVRGQGRGVRKFACQAAGCGYEQPPFSLSRLRRREEARVRARRREERATASEHWTHEVYG